MAVQTGPTANLPGYARRSGLAGSVLIGGKHQGQIVAVEWGTEVEQIAVRIPGQYRTEMKPGGETRTGSFRVQDVHDKWAMLLYNFLVARRANDRASAAHLPEFDIVTKLDDIGAPQASQWALSGCQIFRMDGGWDQETDLLQRDIPFTFRSETPINTFEYVDGDSPGSFKVRPYQAGQAAGAVALVDYERAWAQLAEHVAGKPHHGSKDLALVMLELQARNSHEESMPEQAFRLYGVQLHEDLRAAARGEAVIRGSDTPRDSPQPSRRGSAASVEPEGPAHRHQSQGGHDGRSDHYLADDGVRAAGGRRAA